MKNVILSANIGAITTESGHQYGARRGGGMFRVTDRDARDVVALGGAVASLAGHARRATGYRCGACGFGSFTLTCGRCGGVCVREAGR